MRRRMLIRFAAAVLGGAALAGYAPAPALARPAPPLPPAPPGEAWSWQPGHWHWDGRAYAWIPGRWIERPEARRQWVPGHWAWRVGNGWVWMPVTGDDRTPFGTLPVVRGHSGPAASAAMAAAAAARAGSSARRPPRSAPASAPAPRPARPTAPADPIRRLRHHGSTSNEAER